jgi:hypothetical protein
MRALFWLWLTPLAIFWSWYFLSLNDAGGVFFSRRCMIMSSGYTATCSASIPGRSLP